MVWLLPAFSLPIPYLPSNIQRRFVSYVLHKFLGRFVKAGALDSDQIDAQIGSGFVQVKDLVLDDQNINSYFHNLPVIFRSGSIGKVTANLPWPNILTAPIALSISDVSCIFEVDLAFRPKEEEQVDLSNSVVSVAEDFVHDQSTDEERELAQQISLPGGFEQGIGGGGNTYSLEDDGVSAISALIENLLSRFKFNATNINLVLAFPDSSELSLQIGDIRYVTMGEGDLASRVAEITSLTVGIRQGSIPPSTPSSTSSSMDETATMLMSQSIASLDPSASIYHSFADLAESQSSGSETGRRTILSLGSKGITVTLTPLVGGFAHNRGLNMAMETGRVTLALNPSDLGLFLALGSLAGRMPASKPKSSDENTNLSIFSLEIPSIDVLLHPSEENIELWSAQIQSFLEQSTRQPPHTTHFHLHLQGIGFRKDVVLIDADADQMVHRGLQTKTLATVNDLTLFSGLRPLRPDNEWISSPIVFFDENLTNPASLGGTIPSPDWRVGKSAFKPSIWRSKVATHGKPPHTSCISVTLVDAKRERRSDIIVSPLQVFLDLELVISVMNLLTVVEKQASFLRASEDAPGCNIMGSAETMKCNSREDLNRGADLLAQAADEPAPPSQPFELHCRCPIIRLQIRCPEIRSRSSSRLDRSGAAVVDVTGLRIIRSAPQSSSQASKVSFESLFASISRSKDREARTFVSICRDQGGVRYGTIQILQQLGTAACSIELNGGKESGIRVTLDLVQVKLDKSTFDSLQYFADDLSRLSGSGSPSTSGISSPQSSRLLGSRYFVSSGQASMKSPRQSQIKTPTRHVLSIGKVAIYLISHKQPEDEDSTLKDLRCEFRGASINLDLTSNMPPTVSGGVTQLSGVMLASDNKTCQDVIHPTNENLMLSNDSSMLEFMFCSYSLPSTTAKGSKVKLVLKHVGATLASPELYIRWVEYLKSPPETFESVPPSEKTHISCKLEDVIVRHRRVGKTGLLIAYIEEAQLDLSLKGVPTEANARVHLGPSEVLFVADEGALTAFRGRGSSASQKPCALRLKEQGHALLLELGCDLSINHWEAVTQSSIEHLDSRVHLCPDTIIPLIEFFAPTKAPSPEERNSIRRQPEINRFNLLSSMDEDAFAKLPSLGLDPDLLGDDLPTNLDYLHTSYAAGTGLTTDNDDEVEFFEVDGGHETIKLLDSSNISWVENYFDNLPPQSFQDYSEHGMRTFSLFAQNCHLSLKLYDGYDWQRTRDIIHEHRKEIRRRLAKLRGVLAQGQTLNLEEEDLPGKLLFNSVYVGLDSDALDLEPAQLIEAIDEELADYETETEMESSWQTIKPHAKAPKDSPESNKLVRSSSPSVEIQLRGVKAEVESFEPGQKYSSRTLVTAQELEIFDHMKTSTWARFLTGMQSGSGGKERETESNMLRVELLTVPTTSKGDDELRLRARLLPLRLHVDQDALDFFKAFFAFKYPDAPEPPSNTSSGPFFQQVEIFPIHIKLDYKPKRVDYNALREGKTIELMNFFHFEGAEMVLRHITLSGITGWPRMFDTLNDLWTPDVKANQLSDFLSGVAPIRSLVNIGSGVADLVLLPFTAYKEDRRVSTGLRKGAGSFLKTTALETLKMGAQLATGTQVVLERAETIFSGQMGDSIVAETLPGAPNIGEFGIPGPEPISRYAHQPEDVKEGLRSAYRSLSKNFTLAGQTILALPLEVHERSGSEGAMRTVVRAVPIALLRPMIGASEAVSKTLLGLRNTVEPTRRHDDENKYKRRI